MSKEVSHVVNLYNLFVFCFSNLYSQVPSFHIRTPGPGTKLMSIRDHEACSKQPACRIGSFFFLSNLYSILLVHIASGGTSK